jgi:hypothetical protein
MGAKRKKKDAEENRKTKEDGKDAVIKRKEEEEQVGQIPFLLRILVVGLTSYVAEKIWRHRGTLTARWYHEEQTGIERMLIVVFEYFVAMGFLFLMGLCISQITLFVQKKRY